MNRSNGCYVRVLKLPQGTAKPFTVTDTLLTRVANLHVPDGRLVPVVNHLLEPQPLVQHPHDDQPSLVARGELRVRRVPGNANLCFMLLPRVEQYTLNHAVPGI